MVWTQKEDEEVNLRWQAWIVGEIMAVIGLFTGTLIIGFIGCAILVVWMLHNLYEMIE